MQGFESTLLDSGAANREISSATKSFTPFTDGHSAMEQVNDGEITPWTDMYGLGIVMWSVVAGAILRSYQ